MAQVQMLEGQVEIRSNAEKFFEVWGHKPYLASDISPDKHPKIELHEGNWHTVGSILNWNYSLVDGERSFVRTKIEEIDEDNKSVTYNIIDGEIFKRCYKSFKPKIQAIPKGESCIVKWTFEYEKMNENAPEPNKYLEFLLSCANDIDARLCRA